MKKQVNLVNGLNEKEELLLPLLQLVIQGLLFLPELLQVGLDLRQLLRGRLPVRVLLDELGHRVVLKSVATDLLRLPQLL